MSFGDGDLHAKVAQLKTERDSYKRRVDNLMDTNGDLCKEINRQDAEIRKQYAEIQKLKADNDELREMYVFGMAAKEERISELEGEVESIHLLHIETISKLMRTEQLVCDMLMNFGCPDSYPCQQCSNQLEVCDIPKRAKKLGIEVDR